MLGHCDMELIPYDKLAGMVGKRIRLSWCTTGANWVLLEVKGDQIRLVTPSTGRERWDKASNAVYTSRHQTSTKLNELSWHLRMVKGALKRHPKDVTLRTARIPKKIRERWGDQTSLGVALDRIFKKMNALEESRASLHRSGTRGAHPDHDHEASRQR